MSDIITVRDIDIITTEIKTIEVQVAKAAIYGCIEIGKRLVEAKEMVGHGGWGKYLEEKVRYSQQWATNLMNLYKEYGNAQESLFESFANSQSFGNIDVTKHILLLSVPAEDRAAFAEEHDAENSTVKELQAAIRERDAARDQMHQQAAKAEQAECRVAEMKKKMADTLDQLDIAGDKLLAKDEKIRQLEAQAEAAEKKQLEATGKVTELNEKLKKAKDAEKAAKAALDAAKANPEIPEAMMEEMRQQVAADAAAKATEELQKQLEAAKIAAAEDEKRSQEAEAKVEAAQKSVLLANPDAAVFKMLFTQVQEDFNKLRGALLKVQQSDPSTGEKLKAAMVTLLDKLKKDIEA